MLAGRQSCSVSLTLIILCLLPCFLACASLLLARWVVRWQAACRVTFFAFTRLLSSAVSPGCLVSTLSLTQINRTRSKKRRRSLEVVIALRQNARKPAQGNDNLDVDNNTWARVCLGSQYEQPGRKARVHGLACVLGWTNINSSG